MAGPMRLACQGSIEIFTVDIGDPFGADQTVNDCDIIFHLSVLIAIPYSYHSPATYVDTKYKRPPGHPAGFSKKQCPENGIHLHQRSVHSYPNCFARQLQYQLPNCS